MASKQHGDSGRRVRRVAEQIRSQLSSLLIKSTRDPRLAWVSITDVDLSPDLKSAKVYFSTLEAENISDLEKGLKRAAPYLQKEIGQRLKLRYTPKLHFFYDETFEQGSRIDALILETKRETRAQELSLTIEQQLARLVSNGDKILVCTHSNPDGDAMGSLLAMGRILGLLGKQPTVYCPEGISKPLAFLPGVDDIITALPSDETFDVTLLLDTGGLSQLPKGFPDEQSRGTLVVIDHHQNHDEFGDVVIRRESSSVGELLFDLCQELVWPIDAEIAACLYTSVVSDTGSFKYTNTTAHTHYVAGELIALGAQPWQTATSLFESHTIGRQRLLGKLADTITISEEGKLAQLYCTPDMLAHTGAGESDLEGLVNLGRGIVGVEIAALYKVQDDSSVKVSLRSNGKFDVSGIASQLGGGGHRNAAGMTLSKATLEDAMYTVGRLISDILAS